jgi:hypothetical protein
MFQMDFDKKALKGLEPVPAGIYDVRLVGFEPKPSKNGDSANLNPIFTIVNHPEFEGRTLKYVFVGNSKIPSFLQDMVHCFGEEMEDYDSDRPRIPGIWDADKAKFDQAKIETYVYSGPLLNKVGKVELIEGEYQGRKNNRIRKFFCNVPQCAERFPDVTHSDNVAGK